MQSDVFWSLFAMPIGVTICFGPALIVYALVGSKTPFPEKPGAAESKEK